jgi:hypothetical protein
MLEPAAVLQERLRDYPVHTVAQVIAIGIYNYVDRSGDELVDVKGFPPVDTWEIV